jgi:hypothetical protein
MYKIIVVHDLHKMVTGDVLDYSVCPTACPLSVDVTKVSIVQVYQGQRSIGVCVSPSRTKVQVYQGQRSIGVCVSPSRTKVLVFGSERHCTVLLESLSDTMSFLSRFLLPGPLQASKNQDRSSCGLHSLCCRMSPGSVQNSNFRGKTS